MKFCNHCGRLYSGDKCSCRKEKRIYAHDRFYDSPAWRTLSTAIRTRDYNLDRLQLYFVKKGRPESGVGIYLYDFLIDAYGTPRRLSGRLLVHHIIPREDNYSRQYDRDNLITLNYHTHEFVHKLYLKHKEEVQAILFDCLETSLP